LAKKNTLGFLILMSLERGLIYFAALSFAIMFNLLFEKNEESGVRAGLKFLLQL
jgi:hypothetical protein